MATLLKTKFNIRGFKTFSIEGNSTYQLQSNGVNIQELKLFLDELNHVMNEHYGQLKYYAKIRYILIVIMFILFFPTVGLIILIIGPALMIVDCYSGSFQLENYEEEVKPQLRRLVERENQQQMYKGLEFILNFDSEAHVVSFYSNSHGRRQRRQQVVRTAVIELTLLSHNNGGGSNRMSNGYYSGQEPFYYQQFV